MGLRAVEASDLLGGRDCHDLGDGYAADELKFIIYFFYAYVPQRHFCILLQLF